MKDPVIVPLPDCPTDIVSSLRLSTAYDRLLVGSWDGSISIYDVSVTKDPSLVSRVDTAYPVTAVCWTLAGRTAFLANTEGEVRAIDLENARASSSPLGVPHGSGVQSLVSLGQDSSSLMVSGSWDKTMRYWDPRAAVPVDTIKLKGKVVAMDSTPHGDRVVVGMAGQMTQVYDVRHRHQPLEECEGDVKYQIRDLKCMPNGKGYAQSTVHGRVFVEYFDKFNNKPISSFAWKAHVQPATDMSLLSLVNALSFHERYGTLFTAGSDGTVLLWDHLMRKRLRSLHKFDQSVVSMDSRSRGSTHFLAIATSDDSFKSMPSTDVSPVPGASKLYICHLDDGYGESKYQER